MIAAWRALDTGLREAPGAALWRAAAQGVREWQWALRQATPAPPACAAWPRAPDLALVFDPLAGSALGPATAARAGSEAGAGGPGSDRRPHAAAAGSAPRRTAQSGLAAPATPAAAGVPRAPQAAAGVLHRPVARMVASMPLPDTPPPGAAPAIGAPAASARFASRMATRLAQPLGAVAQAFTAPGPRAVRPSAAASTARATNVVALPPRRTAGVPPAALPPARAGQRWQALLTAGASSAPARVQALLEQGRAEDEAAQSRSSPAGTDSQEHADGAPLRTPPAHGRQAQRASSPKGRAESDPFAPVARTTGYAAPRAAAGSPDSGHDPDPAWAGVTAALARIEARLAPAPEAAIATMVTPPHAPAAPQWLDDDEHLAQRIHDILRRQARRHGIDTP